ncbi:MAG: nucleotide exchange factor GrpE [Bacteroidia bacterium]|jgi:grpE|nr:nucleotide exchange factor GrpE [Bacteroidia bacterium]
MKKKRENEKFEEGCAQEESQVKQSSEREASCEKNSMENGEPQECGAEGNAVEEQAGRLDADLEALRKELAETKDRLLRMTAEFDNYRKRTLRERGELISQASGKTLEALLPVVDDFDRALASCEKCDTLPSMVEGLELIRKSLYGFLKKEGVEEIEAKGLSLDTDVHDAVAKTPAPEEKLKGKIVDVVRKGYKLRGVVLRHAQVVVGE